MAKLAIHFYESKKGGATYRYARHMETYKGQKLVVSCPAPKGTLIKDLAVTLARALAERKLAVDLPSLGSDPNMTVSQLAGLFKKDALDMLKPKSIIERERELRLRILPHIGSMKLRNVTSQHILPILEDAQLKSTSTLEHVHKVMRRMFNFAVENQYAISESPITKGLEKRVRGLIASADESTEAEDVGLSIEDVDCILQEVKGKPYEIIYHFQIFNGLRIGEALGMKWEDVDFVNDVITVNRQVSDANKAQVKGTHWGEGAGPIVTSPKTKRGRRVIPLQPQTKALLEVTPVEERQGFIYGTNNGTAMQPKNFRDRIFNPVRTALGMMNLLTHDLRKFFGSFLIAQLGVDVITVSKWMGHTNPETTMRIYAKLIPELEQQHKFRLGLAFGA